jgi:hypothetical protein
MVEIKCLNFDELHRAEKDWKVVVKRMFVPQS